MIFYTNTFFLLSILISFPLVSTFLKFDIDFSNGKWEVVSEEEFEGNSHDKITKKVILNYFEVELFLIIL